MKSPWVDGRCEVEAFVWMAGGLVAVLSDDRADHALSCFQYLR